MSHRDRDVSPRSRSLNMSSWYGTLPRVRDEHGSTTPRTPVRSHQHCVSSSSHQTCPNPAVQIVAGDGDSAVGSSASSASASPKPRKQKPPNTLTVRSITCNSTHASSTSSSQESYGSMHTGTRCKERAVTPGSTSKSPSTLRHQHYTIRRSKKSVSSLSDQCTIPGSPSFDNTWRRQSKELSSEDGFLAATASLTPTPSPLKTPSHSVRMNAGSDSSSRKTTPRTPRKSPKQVMPFEPYMSIQEVQQGLKRGELIEGVLRINPKNYEDSYISAPDGRMDIYIGGIHDRNRALDGDVVIVQLKSEAQWKILPENLRNCESKCLQSQHLPVVVENEEMPIGQWDSVPVQEPDVPLSPSTSGSCKQQLATSEHSSENKHLPGKTLSPPKKTRRGKRSNKRYNKNSQLVGRSSDAHYVNSTSAAVDQPDNGAVAVQRNKEAPANYEGENVKDGSLGKKKRQRRPRKQKRDGQTPEKTESAAVDSKEEAVDSVWTGGTSSVFDVNDYLKYLVKADNGDVSSTQPAQHHPLENMLSSIADNIRNLSLDGPADPSSSVVIPPHEMSEVEDVESGHEGSVCSNELHEAVEIAKLLAEDVMLLDSTCAAETNELGDVVSPDGRMPVCLVPSVLNSTSVASSSCKNNRGIEVPTLNLAKVAAANTTSSELPPLRRSGPPVIKAKTPEVQYPSILNGKETVDIHTALKHPLGHKFIQKTAEVVYISETKHSRAAVGHLKPMQDQSKDWALFAPLDHRLPRMMVPMSDCPPNFLVTAKDYAKTLFVARLVDWENTGFAIGRIFRSLGEAGEIVPETEGMLIENDVDFTEFPDVILEDLPTGKPWIIPEVEIAGRRDFRKECVFTIDPPTARDLDDAVSCRPLGDGLYEVGVHIADVSYFVKPGTKLDEVAASRATSVYLVQMVVPMLPRLLCEDLCSLAPGTDRLTMSVVWKMDENGDILDEWFGRTVINSCVQLSYNHAQKMIVEENPAWGEKELPPVHGKHSNDTIVKIVKQLQTISVNLRGRRFTEGALRLDQTKLQFVLENDTGLPSGFSIYEQRDSNRLIEEFMLLANMAVAHKIYNSFPEIAVLRRHPEPNEKKLDEAVDMCAAIGINVDTSSAGSIQESLAKLCSGDDELTQARMLVLYSILSRPMQRALYFCTGCIEDEYLYRHYALNVPLYTHFTSPIRRYPDVMVHRLLSAALGLSEKPTRRATEVERIAQHCNDKKQKAKLVSELSQEMFLAVFIKKSGRCEEAGMVINVMDRSFDALILNMGSVKRVYCDPLPLKKKEFITDHGVSQLKLTWKADDNHPEMTHVIAIFSPVTLILTPSKEPLKFTATMKRPEVSGVQLPSFPSARRS